MSKVEACIFDGLGDFSLRQHPLISPRSSPMGTFRVPPRETSPAAKSVEKRMFSQAMVIFASFISLQQNEVKLKI